LIAESPNPSFKSPNTRSLPEIVKTLFWENPIEIQPGCPFKESPSVNSALLSWKEKRSIESFEIDMSGRLHPDRLLAFLLNCAWKHANQTDFSYSALSERNWMWVLSKIQMEIYRMPVWGEPIILETWGKGLEKLYALRDFAVTTSKGEKLCSATSAWLILDKTSHRPQRLESIMKSFPWMSERNEISTVVKKVAAGSIATFCNEIGVVYSDIDVNKHVNATRYLKWIMDSYPSEKQTKQMLKHIDISFLNEATLEDQVVVSIDANYDGDLCTIRRWNDNQELCRARIEWQSN
jgi:medium-chain acyl-[acyl-carrier-protein] hydrolase